MISKVGQFFRSNFHSEGYHHYKTYEARKAYAESLLKVADKSFLATLLPLISLAYFESDLFQLQLVFALLGFSGGIFLRHQGLTILDHINKKSAKHTLV